MLDDETLRDDPEDFGPNFADSVDTPVARLIKSLVRRWVDSVILGTRR